MILAKALNKILLSGVECVPTGSVHEFEDLQFVELEGLKAVRPATVEEAALYRREHGIVEADVVSDRAELEVRAFTLGVEFRSNISDEKLLDRIIEAESSEHE